MAADSENVSESRLGFRGAVDEPRYEQADNFSVEVMYGLYEARPLVQGFGSVRTSNGRCLCFPNVLQHRVHPFGLDNPTLPGRSRVLVFMLVDPHVRIRGTGDVPPQQPAWFRAELSIVRRFRSLPLRAFGVLISFMDACMSREEAVRQRLELEAERTFITNTVTREIFEREFFMI